jgi:voltage-gated potassium channel
MSDRAAEGVEDSSSRSTILLVRRHVSPVRAIGLRVLVALAALIAVVAIVYLDREGYRDLDDVGGLSLLDAFYYATVSLSTTGYGDITPVSDEARLINVLVITPLRVLFLIVLVGTTLEALTSRSRQVWQVERWRSRVKDHVVVVGFGVKGRSSIATLINNDVPRSQIVVVDPRPTAISEANEMGLVGVVGDATRSEVLKRARVDAASKVVIAPERDDTAVLVTLTARSLNPTATIIVAVREEENADIVKHSGANAVITSSESVGRLLGLATVSPHISSVLEDLLSSGHGLEVAERRVLPREEGRTPWQLDEPVLAVLRDDDLVPYYSPAIGHLVRNDRVVVVRPAEELPWARKVIPDDDE